MASRHYIARVVEVEPLSGWVERVALRIEADGTFAFEPGQYVSLHVQEGGEERIRHYSIASSPSTDDRIELCIAIGDPRDDSGGGAPGDRTRLRRDDRVRLTGPHGSFRLSEPVERDLLFIATGTGVSPLRPMIRRAIGAGTEHQITLLLGVRGEADILFRNEFEELDRRLPRFRFLPSLSRPGASWAGLSGHVQSHLDELVGEGTDVDVYLCGLSAMRRVVVERLERRGVDRRRIHYERYG